MRHNLLYIFFCTITIFCTKSLYATTYEIKSGLECTQTHDQYLLSYSIPDFTIGLDTLLGPWGNAIFSRVMTTPDEYDYLHEDGKPELPFYSVDLILPYDVSVFEITNMDIIDSVIVELPYDYFPAQERENCDNGFSFDDDYYTQYNTTWYWKYCSLDTSNYRQYHGMTFSIFPFHYEPSSRSLIIITEATFEISFNGNSLLEYIGQTLSDQDRLAYNFYDNFAGYAYSIIPPVAGDEYLIVSANEWRNDVALLDFIGHKESLGYNVTVAALRDIGYTPEDIRAYIKAEYENKNTKYVLLVGNVTEIPFFDGIQEDTSDPPSDIYYACLSKENVSNQWKDFSPSVFLGRWPIQTSTQLRNVVDKTIASDLHLGEFTPNEIGIFCGGGDYENYFYNDCKYIYNNIVLSDPYYSGDIIDGRNCQSNTAYAFMKNYLEGNNYTDNPTWMFIYDGHGNSNSIGSPSFIYSTTIGTILTSSLDFQPFGFGFSCLLGNIYADSNFSRSWLTSTEGGVSFLGATTTTYISPDRYFSRKLFNQIKKKTPPITIGEFVGNGKAKYYNCDKVVWRRRQAKKYTLYGDPSLYLYGLDINYMTPNYFLKGEKQPIETVDSQINIEDNILSLNLDNIQSVYIYSITGQLVFARNISQINLNRFPSGIYTIVINADNYKITKKIIL